MRIEADMHIHSHYSDGSMSPFEIVRNAKQIGLKAVCLTDHDTVAGFEEFALAVKEFCIDTIPGIEIGCRNSIHILGYKIDFRRNDAISDFFADKIKTQERDFFAVLERYRKNGIMDITPNEIRQAVNCKGQLGTLHIAEYRRRVLKISFEQIKHEVRKGGICRSTCDDEAYPTAQEAIRFIRSIGGMAILAHPGNTFLHDESNLEESVQLFCDELSDMKQCGLVGIELSHSKHSSSQKTLLSTLAKKMNLIMTGGSDSHGSHKNFAIGNAGIDYNSFLAIKGLA